VEYIAELVQEGRDYEEFHWTGRLEHKDGLSDVQHRCGVVSGDNYPIPLTPSSPCIYLYLTLSV
jgi:hypothetical protein